MSARPVSGYEVRAGKIVQRTLYATRKQAAAHVASFKGLRGFAVYGNRIVETLTTRKRGKNFHQEIGGQGQSWENWMQPLATREEAKAQLLRGLRSKLKSRQADVREIETLLKKVSR